jgi:hypothetical protein
MQSGRVTKFRWILQNEGLGDGCIQCRTLTVDPCLIGLDKAEVVLSVSGEDGAWSCSGRFEGVLGTGIFVPDANA